MSASRRECDLLLDGAVQRAPLGCRPVERFRYLGRVDLVVGQLLQSRNLFVLVGESVSALLHRSTTPAQGAPPCPTTPSGRGSLTSCSPNRPTARAGRPIRSAWPAGAIKRAPRLASQQAESTDKEQLMSGPGTRHSSDETQEGELMGVTDSEAKQLLGSFSVGEGPDVGGLLTLSEDGVSLFVWDTEMISPKTISSTISGVLQDNRIATLFDCLPTGGETFISGRGMTSRTTIFANHAVYGSESLDPSKKCVNRVMFRTDDTNLLFNDREAFALKPRSEQDPSIHATYSGVELIFSVDTSIGKVSARRATPIKEGIDVSEGISISSKVNVEVAFDNEVTYYDAIHRGRCSHFFSGLDDRQAPEICGIESWGASSMCGGQEGVVRRGGNRLPALQAALSR